MTEIEAIQDVTREQVLGLWPDRPLEITEDHTPDKWYWIQDTPQPAGEVGE